jgi:quercetin dioxygenase-like cupin family protein
LCPAAWLEPKETPVQIEPRHPTSKNPPEQFAGDVWVDSIAVPHEADQRMVVATVRFAPGARTAWHSHARGQYLRVTQGVARFGQRDGTIIDVFPGQTIYTAPGEEHFHAASGGSFMEHIAMLESADDPSTTTVWLEHITDDEFNGR